MSNRTFFGLILVLLLVGMLTLTFNIQRVEASGTVYIRSDGSIEPDTAPISSVDNVTYTLTGNITIDTQNDGIVVESDNIVINGADYTVQGTENGSGISLESRSNVTIKNMNIKSFLIGIGLYHPSNINISGNTITNNGGFAIAMTWGSYNSISENDITNNMGGIWLGDSSNNTIVGNNITANVKDGISVYASNHNTVTGNNITANNKNGINLGLSEYDILYENSVTNNLYSIRLGDSSNNTIVENDITANNVYGINLFSSRENVFFHNNLINNTKQVNFDGESGQNTWDNGCEGNYWSNYTGVDSDGNGIGDTPYVIDADNIDNYPLMNPYWSSCDINHDLGVDMKDIGQAAKAYATKPGDPLWDPHADITGQESLIPDGKVDMRDIGLIARNFGEIYPRVRLHMGP